jgi:hypothetical protein
LGVPILYVAWFGTKHRANLKNRGRWLLEAVFTFNKTIWQMLIPNGTSQWLRIVLTKIDDSVSGLNPFLYELYSQMFSPS